MTLTDKHLIDLLPDIPAHQFDFSGTYTDAQGDEHSLTIFDTSYFIMNVTMLYAMRRIMVDSDNPQTYFQSVFASWAASRLPLYLKQAYAYTLKYNPIENYSSLEVMTDDETVHARDSKDTHETTPFTEERNTITRPKRTDETTPYTSETTTVGPSTPGTPTESTTRGVMGFNSATWSNAEKTDTTQNAQTQLVKSGKEKTETTYDAPETNVLTKTGKEKLEITYSGSDTDTRNYTLTKKGNIGVMTPSEMLQKEFDGLFQDLAHRALAEFIDRYTYYAEVI